MNSSNLEDSATKLNNFSFESGWSGSAFELQNGLLNENVASYMKCISDLRYYQQILDFYLLHNLYEQAYLILELA